jgi:hypothetical protein
VLCFPSIARASRLWLRAASIKSKATDNDGVSSRFEGEYLAVAVDRRSTTRGPTRSPGAALGCRDAHPLKWGDKKATIFRSARWSK